MKQGSFYQLFLEQLKDIYSAENQVANALPKMIRAAALPELKNAFKEHLQDTKRQVQRLKKIFSHLGKSPASKKCKGMEGLIKEGNDIIHGFSSSMLRDAALISAAQRIEHYEIAGYGTARAYARHLDLDEVVDFLQESLDEEGEINKRLTKLAEGGFFTRGINEEAQKEEKVRLAGKRTHLGKSDKVSGRALTTKAKSSVKNLGVKGKKKTVAKKLNSKSSKEAALTPRTQRKRSPSRSTTRVQIAARSGTRAR